ncbi:Uncharacterized protein Rs2_36617 [Raphanus sativus]|nr:Uncharacterized protein Rs2_36617 [Raphanus sativus]
MRDGRMSIECSGDASFFQRRFLAGGLRAEGILYLRYCCRRWVLVGTDDGGESPIWIWLEDGNRRPEAFTGVYGFDVKMEERVCYGVLGGGHVGSLSIDLRCVEGWRRFFCVWASV